MTLVLDVDPVLTDISWRENIHLELRIQFPFHLDGSSTGPGEIFTAVEVDTTADTAPNYALSVESLYGENSFAAEISLRDAELSEASATRNGDQVSFLLRDRSRVFHVPAEREDDGSFLISLNVTTFRNRHEIPDGKWSIYPLLGKVAGPPARFDLSKYRLLADYSRAFTYSDNKEAYVVGFSLTEDDIRSEFRLRTLRFSRVGLISRFKRIRNQIRKVALGVRSRILRSVYAVARLTRSSRSTTILFASEQRDRLQGNLESVYNRMLDRGLDKQFSLSLHFWIATNRDIKTRLVQTIRIARADYLVIDDYFPGLDALKVHPTTQIIQAWHAGVGFKAVGYARFGNPGSPPRESSHRKYTWAIAGSKSLRSTYADVFGIEPAAIIPTGLPRIDSFLSESAQSTAIAALKGAYPTIDGRKLVLFAPTYRGRGIRDAHYDYSQIDFKALYDYCGDHTVIGFRNHHFIDDPVPIPDKYTDRFVDLTHYPDGLGLLHAVDVLITDYSSIIYEFSLLDRPMLFYAYDRDAYAATRGFQRDYDEAAPGKVCLTFGELLTALRAEDYESEKVTQFREMNFDNIDTGSSDRFIDWFFLGKMPKEF